MKLFLVGTFILSATAFAQAGKWLDKERAEQTIRESHFEKGNKIKAPGHIEGEWKYGQKKLGEKFEKQKDKKQIFLEQLDEALTRGSNKITSSEELTGVVKNLGGENFEFIDRAPAEALAKATMILKDLKIERSRREIHKQNPDELDRVITSFESYRLALLNFVENEMKRGGPYRTTEVRTYERIYSDTRTRLSHEIQYLVSDSYSSSKKKDNQLDVAMMAFEQSFLPKKSIHTDRKPMLKLIE